MFVLLALAAAPLDATFVLSVDEVPAIALHVEAHGATYTYEATWFLAEGQRVFTKQFVLSDAQPVPEVLALLRRPGTGCRAVLEERTNAVEALCVSGDGGTIDGVPFSGTWGRDGRLEAISVAKVEWKRVASAPRGGPMVAPLLDGVPVTGDSGSVRLTPAVKGARLVKVVGVGDPATVGRMRCLPLARALASRERATVVLGLVIDGGRGYPHAWVRRPDGDVDPSLLPGEPAERVYLELPKGLAGRAYIDLLTGAARLTRGH
jgi:hypothetical protein